MATRWNKRASVYYRTQDYSIKVGDVCRPIDFAGNLSTFEIKSPASQIQVASDFTAHPHFTAVGDNIALYVAINQNCLTKGNNPVTYIAPDYDFPATGTDIVPDITIYGDTFASGINITVNKSTDIQILCPDEQIGIYGIDIADNDPVAGTEINRISQGHQCQQNRNYNINTYHLIYPAL